MIQCRRRRPACPQVESDPKPDGDVWYVDWGWYADHRSYHLDTVLSRDGDKYSGLEFDEIGNTGEYPCAHDVNGMCA